MAAIYELLRIGSEVRIFPLLKLDCEPSPYLKVVIEKLSNQGYDIEAKSVDYEFQKGANKMLSIGR